MKRWNPAATDGLLNTLDGLMRSAEEIDAFLRILIFVFHSRLGSEFIN